MTPTPNPTPAQELPRGVAGREVEFLLRHRTQLSQHNIEILLRRYESEVLARDIKSALAVCLEHDHYALEYSREVSRLTRDVASALAALDSRRGSEESSGV